MTIDNVLRWRAQKLADDLQGCIGVTAAVLLESGGQASPGFAGVALSARDGSGQTARLSLDEAAEARSNGGTGLLFRTARTALGLPAEPPADHSEEAQQDQHVRFIPGRSVTPSELAALITASASAFHLLTHSSDAGDMVEAKALNQVAADVAAMVARARAIACR